MTARDFCYWLQGCIELSSPVNGFDGNQVDKIKKHLAMVFKHEIDPSFGGSVEQSKLNDIHGAGGTGGGPLIRC